jgi:hypothetical protein
MKYSTFSNLTVALIFILFVYHSCSRFDEGPLISLKSVKSRLCRDWKTEYVLNISTGIKHSADYEDWLFSPDKDGSFSNKIIYNQILQTQNGIWELIGSNQLKLEYPSESGDIVEFYTILRLTKKELWLQNPVQEIHYYSE